MTSKNSDTIKRQIEKKFQKLIEIEGHFKNELHLSGLNLKVSRKIYACIDGFVIMRSFSKTQSEPFQFNPQSERLDVILKKNLPIKTNEGNLNLYTLLKNSIGLELQRGITLDLGSQGPGLTFGGRIKSDGFQILVRDYSNLKETIEILEDIEFAQFSFSEFEKLENEKRELKNLIAQFKNKQAPLIISEGKTDWKYFIRALKFFHSKNEFINVKVDWFLKFGSRSDMETGVCGTNFILENSVSRLNKILDSFIESRSLEASRSFPVRIGIFDSDESSAKEKADFNNSVHAIVIQPLGISTELLFSEKEIKSMVSNRRLFLGTEFHSETSRLIADPKISIGNDNNVRNRVGKNKIIDSCVFNESSENIALSKEDFAISVYNDRIKISNESWENFRHVFMKIAEIVEFHGS